MSITQISASHSKQNFTSINAILHIQTITFWHCITANILNFVFLLILSLWLVHVEHLSNFRGTIYFIFEIVQDFNEIYINFWYTLNTYSCFWQQP